MKIKKKTSMLMIASSVAAVVGIAAVSFAAWTGKTQSTLSASAATGTVNTFGFVSNDTLTLTGTPVNGGEKVSLLVPYDQPKAEVATGAYMVSVSLPKYEVYAEGYEITVSASASADVGSSYTLYAKLVESTATVTAPTKDTGLTGWTSLDNSDKEMYDGSANTKAGEGKTLTLYVVLDSTGDAPASEVTFNFNVKVTSESHTA